MTKLLTASQALSIINNNDTIIFTGFVAQSVPTSLIKALNDTSLTGLHYWCTTGLIDAGLLDTSKFSHATASHFGLMPNFQEAFKNKTVSYDIIPQGVLTEILATGKSVNTSIGKGTFIDDTKEDELITYLVPSFDVALVKAKVADKKGNVILNKLGVDGYAAIKTCKHVIVETDRIVETLNTKEFFNDNIISNHFIDSVVLSTEDIVSDFDKPTKKETPKHIMDYVARIPNLLKPSDKVVNLGIGLPEACAQLLPDTITLTVEAGILGGTPQGGKAFGTSIGDDVKYYQHNQMFNMYWKGLLDVAVMGVGEFDRSGCVNVHAFGGKVTGCGGFIDITQSAKTIIFCGKESKKVDKVSSITFNPKFTDATNIYYLTEKCIYVLDKGQLVEYI